jgi:hypothetical protein
MRYNFPRKRERAKRPSFSAFQLVFPPFFKVQPETPPTFFRIPARICRSRRLINCTADYVKSTETFDFVVKMATSKLRNRNEKWPGELT